MENEKENFKEKFRRTGDETLHIEGSRFGISIRTLLYATIFGTIGGIISSVIPFDILIKVWYPITGGTQLVSGHHIIWAAIFYGLTRNKSGILISMLTKGIFEFLITGSYGITIIGINLLEGASLLVGFFLIEHLKESDTNLGWGIAGGIGNITQVPIFWHLSGKLYILQTSLFLLAVIFAFLSGVFITGILGKVIKDYLIRAGVPATARALDLVKNK
jgi:ABC-type thiamin/hydroxymethylpyrimidine transport system permease subunit